MSDSENIQVAEQSQNTSSAAPEYSDVEKQAMELGWVPKEQYNGDPARWKTAEVFVALDEPIKRIESQSRELKRVREALDDLKSHYTKVKETEYNRALVALKAARKQALVDGDIDKFDHLEEQIESVKATAAEIKQTANDKPTADPAEHPEFRAWVNKNPWYESTSYMRKFADDLAPVLVAKGLSRDEIFKEVERQVREEFPNKFRNPNKDTAPSVESGGTKYSSRKGSEFVLDDRERQIMNSLVRSGVLTKEEYIADLKKAKGIE